MKHDLITDNAFGIFIRPRPKNQRRFVQNLEALGKVPEKLTLDREVYTFLVDFFENTKPSPELVQAILDNEHANTFYSNFFVYVQSIKDYTDAVHGLKRLHKQLGQCGSELEELKGEVVKQKKYASLRFAAIEFNRNKIKPVLDLLGGYGG